MQNLPFGQLSRGGSPVLVVTPHTGTALPAELRLNAAWAPIEGRLADPFGTTLLSAALKRGMTCVSALYHPCVIDFNVALDSRPLSSRLNRVGLCRTHTSRGEPLYAQGREPSETDVSARVEEYWKPFHAAIADELRRLRNEHDNVLLLVSHASSWLSPYREQPGAAECNVGTNRGEACDRRLVSAITEPVQACKRSWVVNGKLADAFAAQHYGAPQHGIHAIEVEVAGRWRLDCEARNVASKSDVVDDDAALSEALDSLDAILRAMPAYERAAHAAAGRESTY